MAQLMPSCDIILHSECEPVALRGLELAVDGAIHPVHGDTEGVVGHESSN
jgi:hypothetical protein